MEELSVVEAAVKTVLLTGSHVLPEQFLESWGFVCDLMMGDGGLKAVDIKNGKKAGAGRS